MATIDYYQPQKPLLRTNNFQQDAIIQIRLQLQIAECYPLEALLTNLRVQQGLTVNITERGIKRNINQHLDLEIQGTILQISKGLNYLQSLNLKIRGKPNTEGDSWYC